MEVRWGPGVGDDTCGGPHRTMQVNASGVFASTAVHNRSSGTADIGNEGFALAGAGECTAGSKPVYRAEDSNTSGHALRRGTVSC